MQNYLDKLNNFLNNGLNTLLNPKSVKKGENLIKDFDFKQSEQSNIASNTGSIVIPKNHEIGEMIQIEVDVNKNHAKEAFLAHGDDTKPINTASARGLEIPEIKTEITNENLNLKKDFSKPKGQKPLAQILLSLILIGISFAVYKYVEFFTELPIDNAAAKESVANSFVRSDFNRSISLEPGINNDDIRKAILRAIYNEEVKPDKVTVLTPMKSRETEFQGKKIFVTEAIRGDDVFFMFARSAPIALRTISSDQYALGVANVLGKNETFFTFSVTDKIMAIKEMTGYEANMYNDFKELMRLRETSGETSFKDISINNHMLRVMTDSEGIVMVYGHGRDKKIVIAGNVDTFTKVFERLD